MIRTLLVILLLSSSAFAADSFLCVDTDGDGVLGIIKDSGVIDRNCNGHADAASGGSDCDDTIWDGSAGTYATAGCAGGSYKICDASSGSYGACAATDIHTAGYNTYYISGSGSGTTCSSASPCTLAAVSNGGTVTLTNPAEIVLIGATDVTTGVGWSAPQAGNSAAVPNIISRDPRSIAKINLNVPQIISIGFNNWTVRGLEITGADGTSAGGILVANGVNNTTIFQNFIHDVKVDNLDNGSGIYVGSGGSGTWVHDNNVVNAYDPTKTLATDTRQNIWLINAFNNQGMIIEGNHLAYKHAPNTVPYEQQGGGLRCTKHGNTIAGEGDTMYCRNNTIAWGEQGGIIGESAKTTISGNLLIANGGQSISMGPGGSGGSASWDQIIVQHNTVISGPHVRSNSAAGGAIGWGVITPVETIAGAALTDGNVVDDSAQTTYGTGNNLGMVVMLPTPRASNDAFYTALNIGSGATDTFIFTNNCYYNSVIGAGLASGFNVFGDHSFGGTLGSITNFSGVKSSYLYEVTGSVNANPTLDNEYRVTANCPVGTIGWEADWPTASSPVSGTQRKGQLLSESTRGQ